MLSEPFPPSSIVLARLMGTLNMAGSYIPHLDPKRIYHSISADQKALANASKLNVLKNVESSNCHNSRKLEIQIQKFHRNLAHSLPFVSSYRPTVSLQDVDFGISD